MMRLLDSFFGKKSNGKKVMTEVQAPDTTKTADSTLIAAEEPTTGDSDMESTTEAQPAVVSESADPAIDHCGPA